MQERQRGVFVEKASPSKGKDFTFNLQDFFLCFLSKYSDSISETLISVG